jgi:hypothetical protein
MVCWLVGGWERSAEFRLSLGEWSHFGLSQTSASRGLAELERAGLVLVERSPGRSSGVTILDVGDTRPTVRSTVCGKRRFYDQQEAQQVLLSLRAKELTEGRPDAHKLHVYVCPVCNALHVGHKDP